MVGVGGLALIGQVAIGLHREKRVSSSRYESFKRIQTYLNTVLEAVELDAGGQGQ